MPTRTEYNNTALEEVLYEVGTSVDTVFSEDDFETMMKAFNAAQPVKELEYHAGFKNLLKQLEDEATSAAQLERSYRGSDEKKSADLRSKRINADYALERVHGILDDAINAPRPVLYQEPQQ